MDAIIPRYHLPETWSGIGTCPVCRLAGRLRVEHENVLPDRMLCTACGTAFEVESDGAHIRLAVAPAVLSPYATSLVDIWRLPSEVSNLVEQALGSGGVPVTVPPAFATEQQGAGVALHAALADALQALPAAAPRTDEMLADELAAALNTALLNAEASPPFTGPAFGTPAEGRPTPGNGMALEAAAATVAPSAPSIGSGAEQSAIGTSLAVPTAPGTAAPAVVGGPAPDQPARAAEFAAQAIRLHEYGNSIQLIQGALERSGATPDEARQAIADVLAVERTRQTRFRGTLQWVAGISLSVMVLLLAVAIGISLAPRQAAPIAVPASGTPGGVLLPALAATATAGQAGATPTMTYNPIVEFINSLFPGDVKIANGPSPTPGPTSAVLSAIFPPTATLDAAARATLDAAKSGLPDWVSTLVPNGLTVLNVPTPSLDSHGPPASACPVTPDNAANLFGGKAQYWAYDRTNVGWVMIVASNPITIRLPANMTASYLVIGSALEMRSAQGPATIHNVNFAAVNCRA